MIKRTCFRYRKPFPIDALFIAVSDPQVHFGNFQYAVDFLLEPDVPVIAANDGTVVDVKDDSSEGGLEEKYKDIKYQNYITIRHNRGEFSQYVHIAQNSAFVKVGDKVLQGDIIADGIGMVGYTGAPHLHFMVFNEADNEDGFESLKIRWHRFRPVISHGKGLYQLLEKPKNKRLVEAIINANPLYL
ncbi:M23 family metallopeptidase [Candidatus Woesearchaeota archaeon]|nr:M23 family metallopeptidase [Candidatus Woesearchaeota archaeon]